jgi:hypothetical protein
MVWSELQFRLLTQIGLSGIDTVIEANIAFDPEIH